MKNDTAACLRTDFFMFTYVILFHILLQAQSSAEMRNFDVFSVKETIFFVKNDVLFLADHLISLIEKSKVIDIRGAIAFKILFDLSLDRFHKTLIPAIRSKSDIFRFYGVFFTV